MSLCAVVALSLVVMPVSARAESAFPPVIHRYHDAQVGRLNAYLVETEYSVVAIDAGFLVTHAQELRALVDSLGKPLRAILLTHDHADHYNGAALLRGLEAEVPILATERTARAIRAGDRAREERYAPSFGALYPKQRAFPTRTLRDGESLSLDAVTFTVRDLGPGESQSDAYWLVTWREKKYAFIGDLVLNRVHAFFQEGRTQEWLRNLERMKEEVRGVTAIYPGHGEPGSVEMLDWQIAYIGKYREAVQALAGDQAFLGEEDLPKLIVAMEEFLPGGELKFLIPLGADVVAAELALEQAREEISEKMRKPIH